MLLLDPSGRKKRVYFDHPRPSSHTYRDNEIKNNTKRIIGNKRYFKYGEISFGPKKPLPFHQRKISILQETLIKDTLKKEIQF